MSSYGPVSFNSRATGWRHASKRETSSSRASELAPSHPAPHPIYPISTQPTLLKRLTFLTTSSNAPLTSFTSPLFLTLTTGLASTTATTSCAGGGVADPLAGAMAVVELVDSRSDGGDGVVAAEERFLAMLIDG